MKELRKCLYCGKSFDINSIPYKTVGRRYIEETCYADYIKIKQVQKVEREENHEEYREILDWAKDHLYSPNYPLIQKQIKEFLDKGIKYDSIYKTLLWYYDVCGNDTSKANGIGIVPYQYDRAKEYYRHIWELERQAQVRRGSKGQEEEISIISPKRNPYRPKKFSFLDEGGEDGE